jgi:hypothetical protein
MVFIRACPEFGTILRSREKTYRPAIVSFGVRFGRSLFCANYCAGNLRLVMSQESLFESELKDMECSHRNKIHSSDRVWA